MAGDRRRCAPLPARPRSAEAASSPRRARLARLSRSVGWAALLTTRRVRAGGRRPRPRRCRGTRSRSQRSGSRGPSGWLELESDVRVAILKAIHTDICLKSRANLATGAVPAMSPEDASARPPGSAGADQSRRLHPSALGHVTRIRSMGMPFTVVGIGEIAVPAGRTTSGGRLPGRPSRPPAAARGGASPGRADVGWEIVRNHDAVAHPGAVLIPRRHHRRATAGCRDRAAPSAPRGGRDGIAGRAHGRRRPGRDNR